jgi:hypothetical protein
MAEKEVLELKGIWIPLGKLKQIRTDCVAPGTCTNAHTKVWLEVSDMDTVERGKTNGMKEEKRMK